MSVALPARSRLLPAWLMQRPRMGQEALALLAAVFFTVACNQALWQRLGAVLPGPRHLQDVLSLAVAITALHAALLMLVFTRWTAKPLLAVLLVVSALASHYMSQYMVYLDADMIRNILHTDGKESAELVSVGLLGPTLLFGVVPAVAVGRVHLHRRPLRRAVLVRLGWLLAMLVLAGGALMVSFQDVSALMRNHKEVRYLVTPGNYVASLARVALADSPNRPRTPIGQHATLAPRAAGSKPRLLVLVVGETVRAQNWGLNGYARQTTPQLAARSDVVNFPDVTACGSATEVSVPCMFSPWGRRDYDQDRIKHSESLLHVLAHAGVGTLWRDNQTGCKGVCDGLPFESFEHAKVPPMCDDERCLDEVMLRGLQAAADAGAAGNPNGDAVIVLHQLGNHGPAYFRRYPSRLRRFVPACETSELAQCSREQITNGYDNAILYTDDFLVQAIGTLSAMTGRDTALLYVSDHGESLGENGLYLHGIPYAIAPDTQTRVPMLAWLSPGFAERRGIDTRCLRERAAAPASHDNLFHSVLGLMQVRTPEYRAALDVFAGCGRG